MLRVATGADVGLRCKMHRRGDPWWKYQRGRLSRRGGIVRWRPYFAPWRPLRMDRATVTGTSLKRSAANGDRILIAVIGVPVDHVAVVPYMARVAEALLRSSVTSGGRG